MKEIKPASGWIKTPNGQMKMEGYGTMQVLEKSGDKIIKMKFANTAYVPTTSMTLVSSTKLIKEGYDRDMHTKTLVHVATDTKVCDIEEHFEIMTLEYVENAAPINPRSSTTTVEMTAPNEVLNEASNKKIKVLNNQTSKKHEMLNNQAPKEKEVEKTPQPITNSESVSLSITHGKSDREHTMKLNQSDEKQRNKPSLNNPHPSRQINSEGDGDHFTKAPNTNDGGPKERFTKALNGDPNKHKKPRITNQKEMENSHPKTHHKNPNRTAKA